MKGLQMTTSEHAVAVLDGERTKPTNPWVETAWAVLEAADDLDDKVTIGACQRVIDDDFGGKLPAQSDFDTIFSFLNAHAH
jgi:aminoglycoside phosphotransferase (APT) family kinase protein